MSKSVPAATKIILLRHAEKPAHSGSYGVTAEGKHEKESLSVRGWQRAGALAYLFAQMPAASQNSLLAVPQFLYASKPLKHHSSHRSLETITPLAEKLVIKINSEFSKFETRQMTENALSRNGVVLICWQHNYIPQIANLILGDKTTAPQSWAANRFDLAWIFDKDSGSHKYHFKQIPLNLLAGDLLTILK